MGKYQVRVIHDHTLVPKMKYFILRTLPSHNNMKGTEFTHADCYWLSYRSYHVVDSTRVQPRLVPRLLMLPTCAYYSLA